MSPAARLWLRFGIWTAAAVLLLLAVSPARPHVRLGAGAGVVVGAAGGVVLFALVARRPPRLAGGARWWGVVAGKTVVLGVWAANEEIVWRRVVAGELLRSGGVVALVASTVGFALLHGARRRLHLGTGGAFGALYLATGALSASIAAHWTYNVLVGGLVARERQVPP